LPSSCSPPILERVLLFSTVGKDSVVNIALQLEGPGSGSEPLLAVAAQMPRPASGPCWSQERETANFRTRWQRT
jgi:hypothetical protein